MDKNGTILKEIDHKELSKLSKQSIKNHYVAKVKPGKHSLVIPLGAKADINISIDDILQKEEMHTLKLIDISGIEWLQSIQQ